MKIQLEGHEEKSKKKRKLASLKGLWAGLNISDRDIEEAKKELFIN